MSTQRTLWIIFCLCWVGFWLIPGWFFLPLLNVVLAGLSAFAIAIPIGKSKREMLITPGFEQIGNRNGHGDSTQENQE